MNLDDSINNDSKTLKENSPNVNNSSKGKSNVISATPGFGILGGLAFLYVGFKLRRK